MSELKSCPFCGGNDIKIKESEPSTANFNEGAVNFSIECLSFDCKAMPRLNLWHVTPEDAIDAWNTRAPQSEWISVANDELKKNTYYGVRSQDSDNWSPFLLNIDMKWEFNRSFLPVDVFSDLEKVLMPVPPKKEK